MDRLLTATLSVSLLGHVIVSVLPLAPMPVPRTERARRLKLVPKEPAQFAKRRSQVSELRETAQARLSQPPPALPGGFEPSGALPPSAGSIVVRPVMGLEAAVSDSGQGGGSRSALAPPSAARMPSGVIDLADLQAAAGNPVLLSYFGALREQIQQVANTGSWPTAIGSDAGLVYISFVIQPKGTLRAASVMPDRTSASQALRDAALRMVTSAAPFPPVPPSYLKESPEMTVLVPIEFSQTRP